MTTLGPQSTMPASILAVPAEVWLDIASYTDGPTLRALASTRRYFRNMLVPKAFREISLGNATTQLVRHLEAFVRPFGYGHFLFGALSLPRPGDFVVRARIALLLTDGDKSPTVTRLWAHRWASGNDVQRSTSTTPEPADEVQLHLWRLLRRAIQDMPNLENLELVLMNLTDFQYATFAAQFQTALGPKWRLPILTILADQGVTLPSIEKCSGLEALHCLMSRYSSDQIMSCIEQRHPQLQTLCITLERVSADQAPTSVSWALNQIVKYMPTLRWLSIHESNPLCHRGPGLSPTQLVGLLNRLVNLRLFSFTLYSLHASFLRRRNRPRSIRAANGNVPADLDEWHFSLLRFIGNGARHLEMVYILSDWPTAYKGVRQLPGYPMMMVSKETCSTKHSGFPYTLTPASNDGAGTRGH